MVAIEAVLVFQGEPVGVRASVNSAMLYDIDLEVFSEKAKQAVKTYKVPRLSLVEKDGKLVTSEELESGSLVQTIETRNAITEKIEQLLLSPRVKEVETKVSVSSTEEPKQAVGGSSDTPLKESNKKDKVKKGTDKKTNGTSSTAKSKKSKEKTYIGLLTVKYLTPDGSGVEEKEVKREIVDTNKVNAGMKLREFITLEFNVPMKDVKLVKIGLKKDS